MKLHRIVPGLWQRGDTAALDRELKIGHLRARGIDMVINMWLGRDADIADSRTITYVHLPIPDGALPAMAPLEMLAQRAADHIRAGGGVMVQCHAGRNRSGLMSALIVRALNGVDGHTAMETVRAGRPNALANPHFEAYLEALR